MSSETEKQESIIFSPAFWAVMLGIFSIIHLFLGARRIKTSSTTRNFVTNAPCGILEGIRRLGDTKGPTFLLEMMGQCGSEIFKLRLPIKHGGMFIVGDPKAAREILLDSDTEKPRQIYRSFDNATKGKTIFTRTNKDMMWHHARKGSNPAFSSSEVKRLTRICNQRLVDWVESTLEPCIAKNETFDPSEEMARLLFYTIMEVGFEYTMEDAEYQLVSKALEVALTEFVFKQGANPLREIFGLLIPSRRRAHRAANDLNYFMSKVLKSYREKKDKSPNNTIIKLIVGNPEYKSDGERVSELLFFIIAGHDTTAYQISSILVLLAKHPEVADKLRIELARLDSSEWSKSDYLRFVISESSRLVPVAAMGSVRTAGRDFSFKDGAVKVPKGAIIALPQLLLNWNQDTFPNPDKFDPERWASPTQTAKEALMPFSLGKRNCIGQRLATTELYSCVPMLLSKYKFEVVEEGELIYFLTYKYQGARLRAARFE